MPDLAARARTLLDLHTAPEILVLANVWDVASARVVAGVPGVRALATASHSIAATFGYEDGENIPLDLHLDMVARIVAAVDVPVTMDFEAGYGDAGETARRVVAAGAVGGNLEDRMRPLDEAVAAVEAVLAAGRDAGIDFVLNARTDAFVRAPRDADRGHLVEEAIRRGRAFLEAGAPVVFVPGVVARDEIAALVEGLGPRKLTVIGVPGRSLPVRELQELGVARMSTGPFTQRVALTALQDATAAVVGGGVLPADTRPLNRAPARAVLTPRGEEPRRSRPVWAQLTPLSCRSPGQVNGGRCFRTLSSWEGRGRVRTVRARGRGHRRDP
jgi:2-methylisocitrate lyase-like PEP mutase family enzyme